MSRIKFADTTSARIDTWLGFKLDRSRSFIKKCCDEGQVQVNSFPVKANYKLKPGDIVDYDLTEEPLNLSPMDMELDIVFEDDSLIVINKPSGLTVHPGAGNRDETLVNALLHYNKQLSTSGGLERPGIVHRLDKDTSGLIVIAKNNKTHHLLADLFKQREVEKRYMALVTGYLKEPAGLINAPIARHPDQYKKFRVDRVKGKEAITEYQVCKEANEKSLVEVRPKTGRTHQIRVHLAYIGHPLVGDSLYGKKGGKRHLLHAYYLAFNHPINHTRLEIEAPLPKWAVFS